MKQLVRMMCIAAFTLGLSMSVQAQPRELGFFHSINVHGDLPVGKFASDVSSNHTMVPLTYTEIGKDAVFGFGVGYRISHSFPVGVGLVAPFASIDAIWNMIGSNWSDTYTQARSKATPTYFNIPAMVGVSYLYNELWNGDITPFAEAGIGADVFIITAEGPSNSTLTPFPKYAYKPNTSLAWMIGIGSYFGRNVSAGIYYYGLGKHPIEYTNSTYNNTLNVIEQAAYDNGEVQTRTVGTLTLRIGFHF